MHNNYIHIDIVRAIDMIKSMTGFGRCEITERTRKVTVEMKSFNKSNPAQQRLIYIENDDDNVAINGSADFTTEGLGFSPSTRLDMNTCMYG